MTIADNVLANNALLAELVANVADVKASVAALANSGVKVDTTALEAAVATVDTHVANVAAQLQPTPTPVPTTAPTA